MDKRKSKLSAAQKSTLIEYLQNRAELVSGKFSSNYTFKHAQAEWTQLAATLNSIPGARKDWRQWRKAWQDIKKSTKQKSSAAKRHAGGTGGGSPSFDTLTQTDEGVLGIIGNTAVEGHEDCFEVPLVFNLDEDNAIVESEKSVYINISGEGVTDIPERQEADGSTIEEPKVRSTPLLRNKRNEKNKKRLVASHRLTNTISATDRLAAIAEQKCDIKKKYYERKIIILEQQLAMQERQVRAQESIAEALLELI